MKSIDFFSDTFPVNIALARFRDIREDRIFIHHI